MIDHDGEFWRIVVTGRNTIEVHNSMTGYSYNSNSVEHVHSDSVSDDLRVGRPSHCNLMTQGSCPDIATLTSIKKLSHGEIDLNYGMPRSSVEVFDFTYGNTVRMMHLSIEDATQENSPETVFKRKIRLCDYSFNTLIEPSYQVQMRYDISLLFFGVDGDWINLSANPETPAWLDGSRLPVEMAQRVKTREAVCKVVRASESSLLTVCERSRIQAVMYCSCCKAPTQLQMLLLRHVKLSGTR